jgi:hypothetical protein
MVTAVRTGPLPVPKLVGCVGLFVVGLLIALIVGD